MTNKFGGSWTEKKLECLENYLRAYLFVMKQQPFRLLYIDAFAGSGYRQEEDDGFGIDEFLMGSAKRALRHNFDQFIFIEKSPEKCEKLNELKKDNSGKNITIFNGDANGHIPQICGDFDHKTRAVCFVDPYAMDVQWNTLKAIATTCAIDLWVLFPAMAVNRVLSKDIKKVDSNMRKKLEGLFGTKEWEELFYQESSQLSLFNGDTNLEKIANFEVVKSFYMERLRTIFGGVAPNPLPLKNSTKSTMFYLFFAVSHKGKGKSIAVKIAQHILGQE